jgi:hypothetical protein
VGCSIKIGQRHAEVVYESKDHILAIVNIRHQEDEVFRQHIREWSHAFHSVYNFTQPTTIADSRLSEAEQQKLRYYEQAIHDLMSSAAQLNKAGIEQVQKQADYLQKKSAELDEQFRARGEEQRKEHEGKLAQVAAHEAALADKEKKIDLRHATIARRQHLTDLRTLLSKQFTVSKLTTSLRMITHLICLAAMAGGAVLMWFAARKLLSEDKLDWHHGALMAGGTLLFTSTFIYYLRWTNDWFRRLADSEFASRKLDMDSVRSSWLAEMLFEWNDEKAGKPFPADC